MKNKKNTIMLVVIIISLVILTWNKSYSYEMNDNIQEEKEIERKEFGIYYQTTGEEYEEKDSFPTKGYLLNEEKTECYEYGSNTKVTNAVEQSLTKGVIDGTIIVTSNKSMYCNIYFDKDDTLPTIKTFTLTGTPDTGTTLSDNTKYTHTTTVNYQISWNDNDVSQICVKDNGDCTETDWKQIEGTSKNDLLTVSNTDGEKTINAYLKDKANNISEVKTGEITLDTTNPTIELTEDASKITENSIVVSVTATDTNEIKSVACKATGGGKEVTGSYNDSDKTCTFSNLVAGMEYTITGEATDESGRKGTNIIKITTKKAGLTSSDLLKEDNRPEGLSDKILGESPENSSTYNDDMYRFVGACNAGDDSGKGCNGVVDNFVCFGYTDSKTDCVKNNESGIDLDNDYIYRMIGITRDGRMKLIKNTAIGEEYFTYRWNDTTHEDTTWGKDSKLYRRLNGKGSEGTGTLGNSNLFIDSKTGNVQYITTTGDTAWYDKIDSDHQWLYGKMLSGNLKKNSSDGTAENIYKIETGQQAVMQDYEQTGKWTDTIQAAVGLMYISDYYYSYAENEVDSSDTNCYNNSSCKNSWLNISNNGGSGYKAHEWTMTSNGIAYPEEWPTHFDIYAIDLNGPITWRSQLSDDLVRPVFYLDSDVIIFEGAGTSSDPFIIAK